jgi:hypothetical protein
MAVRKDHAKCTPKKFKYFKTWWLNEKRIILSSGPVLLVLLIILLVARSFIYVGRRKHEFMPSVFASLDTFTAGSDAPLEIPLPAQSGLERDMK